MKLYFGQRYDDKLGFSTFLIKFQTQFFRFNAEKIEYLFSRNIYFDRYFNFMRK